MRLHLLLLLFISGLSPNLGYAGTLVGDWYQEEMGNEPNNERRAFSLPISQSTEANQVTLGIKSPGLMDPFDFYAVISGKSTNANCQLTVREIIVDAEIFSVGSNTDSSGIAQILAKTDDVQKRLWRAFRKGKELSLKIDQVCGSENVHRDEVNTFNYSLSGSSAAYRFVARQEVVVARNQESRKIPEPGDATKPGNIGATADDESSYTIFYLLAFALLIVVLIKIPGRSRTKHHVFDPPPARESMKPVSRVDAYVRQRDNPVTVAKDTQVSLEGSGASTSERSPGIASFPCFRVERVVDGDTVIVSQSRQKLSIRLSSIDCPEDGQEWGNIARAGLIKLIGGRHVLLEGHGMDHYGRTIATLYVQNDNGLTWVDVNERMVTLGHAWVMRRYYKHLPNHRQTKLNQLERWAKSKRIGLWKLPNPIPPWEWRQGS